MLSLRRLILTLGLANLIVLGLIACGEPGAASDPDAELRRRVERLETRLLQMQESELSTTHFMRSQHELNKVAGASLTESAESAVRMGADITRNRAALNQLAEIVKDMLRREK